MMKKGQPHYEESLQFFGWGNLDPTPIAETSRSSMSIVQQEDGMIPSSSSSSSSTSAATMYDNEINDLIIQHLCPTVVGTDAAKFPSLDEDHEKGQHQEPPCWSFLLPDIVNSNYNNMGIFHLLHSTTTPTTTTAVIQDESQLQQQQQQQLSSNNPSTTKVVDKHFNTKTTMTTPTTTSSSFSNSPKTQPAKWLRRYKELCHFKDMTGHCIVPYNYEGNKALAQWVKRQRHLKKHSKKRKVNDDDDDDEGGNAGNCQVIQDREEMLNRLGFVWDAHEASWEGSFYELINFKKKHGHVNVPSRYPENPPLAAWIKVQRRQYNPDKIMTTSSSSSFCSTTSKGSGTGAQQQEQVAAATTTTMTPERKAYSRMMRLSNLGFIWNARIKSTSCGSSSSISNSSSNNSSVRRFP